MASPDRSLIEVSDERLTELHTILSKNATPSFISSVLNVLLPGSTRKLVDLADKSHQKVISVANEVADQMSLREYERHVFRPSFQVRTSFNVMGDRIGDIPIRIKERRQAVQDHHQAASDGVDRVIQLMKDSLRKNGANIEEDQYDQWMGTVRRCGQTLGTIFTTQPFSPQAAKELMISGSQQIANVRINNDLFIELESLYT